MGRGGLPAEVLQLPLLGRVAHHDDTGEHRL